jgi:hypothetical protein
MPSPPFPFGCEQAILSARLSSAAQIVVTNYFVLWWQAFVH